MIFFSKFETN